VIGSERRAQDEGEPAKNAVSAVRPTVAEPQHPEATTTQAASHSQTEHIPTETEILLVRWTAIVGWWTRWVGIFTGLLFVATLGSAIILYSTDITLQRSVEIARTIMTASERAQILVSDIKLTGWPQGGRRFPEFKVTIGNGGKALGHIEKGVVVLMTGPANLVLPDIPNYGVQEDRTFNLAIFPSQPFEKTGQLIEPRNTRLEPLPVLREEQKVKILSGDDLLFVYGYLDYSDGFSRSEGNKKSGFCMTFPSYVNPIEGVGITLVSCGYGKYVY
jgi:hypothetical protein